MITELGNVPQTERLRLCEYIRLGHGQWWTFGFTPAEKNAELRQLPGNLVVKRAVRDCMNMLNKKKITQHL